MIAGNSVLDADCAFTPPVLDTDTLQVTSTSSEADCFWCGDLMFPSSTRLVCAGCAWTVDHASYQAI